MPKPKRNTGSLITKHCEQHGDYMVPRNAQFKGCEECRKELIKALFDKYMEQH